MKKSGSAGSGDWKKNSYRIAGALIIALFLSLLVFRLQLFHVTEEKSMKPLTQPVDRETWMNIVQKGQKLGYVHRVFFKTDDGGFKVQENISMRLNTMGMAQDVRVRTEGNLKPDLSLSSFDFELQSNLYQFKASGLVKGRELTIISGPESSMKAVREPLESDIYLASAILDSALQETPRPGVIKTLLVFDPATASQRPVHISYAGEESVRVMGRHENARKYTIDFMGSLQTAWVGSDGTILREKGFLGIELVQVSKEEALSEVRLQPGTDLVEISSIKSNRILENPLELRELTLRAEGLESTLQLTGGRQRYSKGVLTIARESLPSPPLPGIPPEFEKKYLQATLFIQSDNEKIRETAMKLTASAALPEHKARNIFNWVYRNIQKKPVLSVPNALETLERKEGDCNEHAVLMAALLRAAGIPADIEAGLVYIKGRFYYHAWNKVYLGSWITADAALGQFPADVTHIRLVRGMESQTDLLGVIGKLKLEIIEAH